MKTIRFLYRNASSVYVIFVVLLAALVHLFMWVIFYLLDGPVPSVKFMISYIIVISAMVIFIFGKRGPEGFRKRFLRMIEKAKQKDKLKNGGIKK